MITAIVGPMFASKTTTLISKIDRHVIANKKCVIVKHGIDTRFNDKIHDLLSIQDSEPINKLQTHNPNVSYSKCPIITAFCLKDIYSVLQNFDVIGITEGQFYPDLVEYIEKFAANGKKIYVDGLNGDYKQEPFLIMSNLLAKAEVIISLTAVCECGDDASFSYRFSSEKDQVVVGAKDKYIALCRKCLNKKK